MTPRTGWLGLGLSLSVSACAGSPPPPAPSPAPRAPSTDPFPDSACPANVFPPMEREVTYLSEHCQPELSQCLGPCEQGDANACYAAALKIQEMGGPEARSEALFLRSCSLGIPSGCTNRAAGIMKLEEHRPGALECATRTFEAMCQRADPWACTMFAFNLATGAGVARDLTRALEALPGGCRLGPDDSACKHALQLKKQIDEARSPSANKPR
jgi:hypothetical protein